MRFLNVLGRFGALASLMLVVGCGSDDETPAETPPVSDPNTMVIDTFNVGLAGAFVPNEAARRQPVFDTLATMASDVVCLQEVWTQSDKDSIINAASGNFPHVAAFQHDLLSPVDDPTDQNGVVPPAPTDPPCSDPSYVAQLNTALDCIRDKCSTSPGSEDGYTTSTDCAEASCTTEALPLVVTSDESRRCYACMATNLPTETIGKIRSECTSNPAAGLAFGGQSGVMVLSRLPIVDATAYVVPGTWNRRIIAKASVQMANGVTADVYCNHLSPIFTGGIAYSYTGQYGGGQTDDKGWAAEQLLQAGKLVAYVEATSGTAPAIILGDFNTGRENAAAGLVAEGVETLDVLESAFLLAVTPDFAPACTHCPDNLNTSETTDPVWIDHIFVKSIPQESISATERTFVEPVVPVEGAGSVPLSDHYGLRSTLTIMP